MKHRFTFTIKSNTFQLKSIQTVRFYTKEKKKKTTYEFLRMMVWSVIRYALFMYSFVCCHSRFTGAERCVWCVWIMWTMTTYVNRNLHTMMQESGKKYFLRNTHRIIECRQAYFKSIFLQNELDVILQIYSIIQNWLFFHGIFPRSKRYIVYCVGFDLGNLC